MEGALGNTSIQSEVCLRPGNYRGSIPADIGAYGRNQFAYMPERGARDALAQLVVTWVSMFAKRRKIAYNVLTFLGPLTKSTQSGFFVNYGHVVFRTLFCL